MGFRASDILVEVLGEVPKLSREELLKVNPKLVEGI